MWLGGSRARHRTSAACALVLTATSTLVTASPTPDRFDGVGEDGGITVTATAEVSTAVEPAPVSAKTLPGAPIYSETRIPKSFCGNAHAGYGARLCTKDLLAAGGPILCADGTRALDPLYRREIDASDAPVGQWVQIDDGCPQDEQPPVFVSVEEFQRLPLAASVPSFQPGNGRGLVNMELIVFTDPAPQVLQTNVLDTPVTVRATPSLFSWDFGDGSVPLVTSDPGAPYPDLRVFHVYDQPGSFQVQLTTTWTGEFQVDGQGPWFPVTGTAQTVSPAFAETVVEARSHLVDGPLP